MYSVGVVGRGNIAAMYANPEDEEPYCHVGGVRDSENVQLQAVTDVSGDARDRFRSTWGEVFPAVGYYESVDAMTTAESLDIIAVCVPGPYHHEMTKEVLSADPRAVFLEKPPTCSLAQMDDLTSIADERSIPITVSYSRHWDPSVRRLQELVEAGVIGEVEQVISYNGGAVLSYASHSTDHLYQFAGAPAETVVASGSIPDSEDVPEGYVPEPTLDSMLIEFENGVTGVQIGSEGEHGEFYCEVIGTDGMVRAGIYIEPAIFDEDGDPVDLEEYDFPESRGVFTVAYDEIAAYLDGGDLPQCTNEHYERVHEIGFGAIESIYTGERIELPNENRERLVFANG